MLKQKFTIDKYDWKVEVYYYIDCYYTDVIINRLKQLGATKDILKDAFDNISSCKLNTGLTYSNINNRHSLIVISNTSSPSQFMNSLVHEIRHLSNDIEDAFNILPRREEASYLSGYIAECMFKKAKYFLCKCYSRHK